MNDFAFVAIMLAFFALAAVFVVACDRIIGTDEEAFAGADASPTSPTPVEADNQSLAA